MKTTVKQFISALVEQKIKHEVIGECSDIETRFTVMNRLKIGYSLKSGIWNWVIAYYPTNEDEDIFYFGTYNQNTGSSRNRKLITVIEEIEKICERKQKITMTNEKSISSQTYEINPCVSVVRTDEAGNKVSTPCFRTVNITIKRASDKETVYSIRRNDLHRGHVIESNTYTTVESGHTWKSSSFYKIYDNDETFEKAINRIQLMYNNPKF